MPLKFITSQKELSELEKSDGLSLVHFIGDWNPQCEMMNEFTDSLSTRDEFKDVTFRILDTDEHPEICLKYNVTTVPAILLLRGGQVVETIQSVNTVEITAKVKIQAEKTSLLSVVPTVPAPDLITRLEQLINSAKCMLFMEGTPDAPGCGYSHTSIELLNKYEADYSTFNILSDEEVYHGLTTYSNWPTYPQLYIDGKLVGGLGILKGLDASGNLDSVLPKKQN